MARGGALNLAGAAIHAVLAFVIVVVLVRGFGAARAGVFFQATSLFLIVSNICEMGADTGLVRMIPRYRVLGRGSDVRRVVLVGLLPGVVLATAVGALLFAMAPHIAAALTQPRHEAHFARDMRMLAPFLPASVALTLLLSATRGLGRMGPSVLVDKIGRSAVQVALVGVAILAGSAGSTVTLAWAVPFLLAAGPAGLWLVRLLGRAGPAWEAPAAAPPEAAAERGRGIASEFWRFSLPRALAASLKVGVDKLDIVLVGSLASARTAGIYAASTRLLIAGTMANVAISQALGPLISRHFAARNRDQAKAAYQSAAAWTTLLTWPIYFNLMVFGPVILRIFGRDYGEASTAVLIVAGSLLVAHLLGPVDIVLLMGGRSLLSTGNMALGLSANVALNVLLVPSFGLTGAGLAWAASLLIINLLALGQIWRSMSIHPFGAATRLAAAGAAVCFGLVPLGVRLAAGATLPAWIAAGVAGTALYAAFCWRQRDALQLTALRGSVRRPRPAAGAARYEPALQAATTGG